MLKIFIVIFAIALPQISSAQPDEDNKTTIINQIDLAAEGKSGPNYILILFDVKKLKVPGSRAHTILRQLSNRVRVEVESAGIPKGRYSVAVASSCGGGSLSESQYKRKWHELHQVQVTSSHMASEKSVPTASLRSADAGDKKVLEGQSLALFRLSKGKFELIDCKPIK